MAKNYLVMGILNVTPDSFSDGGQFCQLDSALRQAQRLIEGGADILDIGGESTRPGSLSVSVEEELTRVLPVIEVIRKNFSVTLSIDTTKVAVARSALEAGASIVNDVSGAMDLKMAELVRDTASTLVVMHMKGTPRTMQLAPEYPHGVVAEVGQFLRERVRALTELGLSLDNIWVDPGIGFGKTLEQNLELLRELKQFSGIGSRLLIGTSRKSFLAQIVSDPTLSFADREAGTVASNLWAYQHGASVFRVHEVGSLSRALSTWNGIRYGSV